MHRMRVKYLILCIILGLFSICPSLADVTVNGHTYQWANWNGDAVINGPPAENTIFTINNPVMVTYLDSYHYNDGKGVSFPGTITLVNDQGEKYGPFEMDSIENEYIIWHLVIKEGELILPAGTYTVFDSDPKTWSNNEKSGNAGIFGINWKELKSGSSNVMISPGSVWEVKEYGPMGNWEGIWKILEDGKTIDASWSDGSIVDKIIIQSIIGDKITLYRQGNDGYYTGTISADGKKISGAGSWYSLGQKWDMILVTPMVTTSSTTPIQLTGEPPIVAANPVKDQPSGTMDVEYDIQVDNMKAAWLTFKVKNYDPNSDYWFTLVYPDGKRYDFPTNSFDPGKIEVRDHYLSDVLSYYILEGYKFPKGGNAESPDAEKWTSGKIVPQ